MKYLTALSALLLLVACTEPMATIPSLSDADIPEEATTLSVMPDPKTETEEAGGFFSNLFAGLSEKKSDHKDDQNVATIDSEISDKGDKTELPPESFGVTSVLSQSPRKATAKITNLPYGQIVRVCDMTKAALGKKVAQYPEQRRGYTLHDTDPGNTAAHTFYLTGFDDGCARQFTASLAVFGSVGMHEQLRYGLPAEVQPYSDTDKAYEKVKSRVCRVPRKKPCGSKLDRLEKDTVFLSIYENFGGNNRWSNLLLHRGDVLAHDIKG